MIDISRASPQAKSGGYRQTVSRTTSNRLTDGLDANADSTSTAQQLLSNVTDFVVQRPGTCLLVGLIAGGVAGWLTSKLK